MLFLVGGFSCAVYGAGESETGRQQQFLNSVDVEWPTRTEEDRLATAAEKLPASALLNSNMAGLLALALEQSQNRYPLRKPVDILSMLFVVLPVAVELPLLPDGYVPGFARQQAFNRILPVRAGPVC